MRSGIQSVFCLAVALVILPAAAAPKNVKFTLALRDNNRVNNIGEFLRLSVSASTTPADYGIRWNLTSLTPQICSVGLYEGGFTPAANALGSGICKVAVSVADTRNYAGRAELAFPIAKKQQAFLTHFWQPWPSTENPSTYKVGDAPYLKGYVTALGGTPVTVTSSNAEVCTATVTMREGDMDFRVYPSLLSPGTCTLTVTRPENESFTAAINPYQWNLVVTGDAPRPQTITPCSPTPMVAGAEGSACYEANAPMGVVMSSQTPEVCSVPDQAGKKLRAIRAGVCTVSLTAPRDPRGLYTSVTVTQDITVTEVEKLTQTLQFDALTDLSVGSSAELSARGGESGLPVQFSSKTPDVCSVIGSTVQALSGGLCSVAANQEGNDRFNAATPVVHSFTVVGAAKLDQVIRFGTLTPIQVGASAMLTASGGDSGNPVVLSSLTAATCSVDGNLVTGVGVGDCLVQARQLGNEQFKDAEPTTQIVKIEAAAGLTAQSIALELPAVIAKGSSETVVVRGGDSGNPVVLFSQTPVTCSVDSTTVTGVAAGLCTLSASQAGSTGYEAAPTVSADLQVREELKSFYVSVSAEGELARQSLTARLSPASEDEGRVGEVFVGASVGGVLVVLGPQGWIPYVQASDLVSFKQGVLMDETVNLVNEADLSSLSGAVIFVGYGFGASVAEAYQSMLERKTLMDVYTVQ